MYLIRTNVERGILEVTFSGRLTSAEVTRAVTQATALAQAGDMGGILVDLFAASRAPGRWMQIAAIASLRLAPGMRVALLASEEQHLVCRRLVRYSGIRNAFRGFTDIGPAVHWLTRVSRQGSGTSESAGDMTVAERPEAAA